ncbi:hypothetical protein AAZX31_20G030200 [Glycine max]
MMLMLLLVLHCLIIVTIKIYLVNMEPFLQLQTGLNVYTKMLGLDFSLGEQQQGRQKGSRSMLCNYVLAEDCDQPDYVKHPFCAGPTLCVEHNVSLLTILGAKTLGKWAGLCKIDSEGKARKVTGCFCSCAALTASLHQLRLGFFLLHG